MYWWIKISYVENFARLLVLSISKMVLSLNCNLFLLCRNSLVLPSNYSKMVRCFNVGWTCFWSRSYFKVVTALTIEEDQSINCQHNDKDFQMWNRCCTRNYQTQLSKSFSERTAFKSLCKIKWYKLFISNFWRNWTPSVSFFTAQEAITNVARSWFLVMYAYYQSNKSEKIKWKENYWYVNLFEYYNYNGGLINDYPFYNDI